MARTALKILMWAVGAIVATVILLVAAFAFWFIREGKRVESQYGKVVPLSTWTPEQLARIIQPGPVWKGKGKANGTLSEADARSITFMPTYWLGPVFSGYNLQDILSDPAFMYGVCSKNGRRCAPPIQVIEESVCRVRPAEVSEIVRAGSLKPVRGGGVMQRFNDGHLLIWTGQSAMSVFAPVDDALVNQAIEQLQGFNALASGIGPGDPLPPPDWSGCPS